MTQLALGGKVAVLVGGSGAIGRECAVRFAASGARVVLTCQSRQREAEAHVAALPGGPHRVHAVELRNGASIAGLADAVEREFGGADVLVNLAGFTRVVSHGDLDALDDATFDDILAVNLRGVFSAIRAFRRLLDASGDGLVVNVSSIAGATGEGSNIAYCAAKAGVNIMGKALARALAPRIRVMTVAPGIVDTSFVPGRDAAFNERVARTIPLGRVATPADVADAVLACATHLNYATGSVITVDGGRAL